MTILPSTQKSLRALGPAQDDLDVRRSSHHPMNEAKQTPELRALLRRWRMLGLIFAFTTAVSVLLLAVTVFLARQDLMTHSNLYYLLWKAGLRPYERPVAFGGLYHDNEYRQRFLGISVEQLERTFPNTFYRLRRQPPNAKPNQEFYIDDYQQAQSEDGGYGMVWRAVFEDGRLIELQFSKG